MEFVEIVYATPFLKNIPGRDHSEARDSCEFLKIIWNSLGFLMNSLECFIIIRNSYKIERIVAHIVSKLLCYQQAAPYPTSHGSSYKAAAMTPPAQLEPTTNEFPWSGARNIQIHKNSYYLFRNKNELEFL